MLCGTTAQNSHHYTITQYTAAPSHHHTAHCCTSHHHTITQHTITPSHHHPAHHHTATPPHHHTTTPPKSLLPTHSPPLPSPTHQAGTRSCCERTQGSWRLRPGTAATDGRSRWARPPRSSCPPPGPRGQWSVW